MRLTFHFRKTTSAGRDPVRFTHTHSHTHELWNEQRTAVGSQLRRTTSFLSVYRAYASVHQDDVLPPENFAGKVETRGKLQSVEHGHQQWTQSTLGQRLPPFSLTLTKGHLFGIEPYDRLTPGACDRVLESGLVLAERAGAAPIKIPRHKINRGYPRELELAEARIASLCWSVGLPAESSGRELVEQFNGPRYLVGCDTSSDERNVTKSYSTLPAQAECSGQVSAPPTCPYINVYLYIQVYI